MAENDYEVIDCWEPSEPPEIDLDEWSKWLFHSLGTCNAEPIKRWFKKELSDALRSLIVEEGIVGISFDDLKNPIIKFWADGAQHEELTCAETATGGDLAQELDGIISDYGSSVELARLREVMLMAIAKIDLIMPSPVAGSPPA